MKAKLILGVFLSLALVGRTTQAEATNITVTVTGQASGQDSGGEFCSGLGCTISGPFSLVYTFDTSLATPGNYINLGSSSSLSGSSDGSCLGCSSSVVGSVTGTIGTGTFSILPNIYTCCSGFSAESDSATKGSTSQSVLDDSMIEHGTFATVNTSIFNPTIPGDITAPYYLFGPDLGFGLFYISEGTVERAIANLQIETVSANGAMATPLPAALPLFAGGLGVMGRLGWRKKRKAAAQFAAA